LSDGRRRALLLAVLLGLAPTACGSLPSSWPEAWPASWPPEAWPSREAPPERRAIPPSGTHVVRSGETLSEIAHIYGLDLQALARANGIDDVDELAVGRRLALRWDDPPSVAAPLPRAAPARRAQRPDAEPADDGEGEVEPLRVIVTPPDDTEPAAAEAPADG